MRAFSVQVQQEAATPAQEIHVPLDLENATPAELHTSPLARKIKERYPGVKVARLPRAIFGLDFDRDIVSAEERLINEYGFLQEEIKFVMRYNPKFILLGQQSAESNGIEALKQFFVQEKGFDMDTVRTLVVRYPYVLSKSREELTQFFVTLKAQGLSEEEIMKALLESPKLISKHHLDKQIKEMQFIFRLYHGINEQEVNEIFKSFPYLYCCEPVKVQKFMGEFRKYRMTKD